MNIFRKFATNLTRTLAKRQFSGSLYEPDYLEAMKPKHPLYDTINVQVRGYDFAVLENYQKLVHNLLKNMDINVEDSWAVPHQHLQIIAYKPNSSVVSSQYNLRIYERTIQITEVSSLQLPIILRTLEQSTPVGVTVHVLPHEQWHEDVRYVPDSDLKILKEELDDLGGPITKKKN